MNRSICTNTDYISSFMEKVPEPEDCTRDFIRGEVVTGKVVAMFKEWALVEVNNKMASVCYTRLAWKYVFDPSNYISVGEKYEFISLRNTSPGKKGRLSLRRHEDNQWQELKAKLHVGDKYKARVVQVNDKQILFLLPGLDVVARYTRPKTCKLKYNTGDIQDIVIKNINLSQKSYDGGLSVYVACIY